MLYATVSIIGKVRFHHSYFLQKFDCVSCWNATLGKRLTNELRENTVRLFGFIEQKLPLPNFFLIIQLFSAINEIRVDLVWLSCRASKESVP